jgi:chaperonin cofactor prefoldin
MNAQSQYVTKAELKEELAIFGQELVMTIFKGLEPSFEKIYQRFDRIELRMDRLELRMDKLEERMDHLEFKVDRLERHAVRTDERIDRLDTTLTTFIESAEKRFVTKEKDHKKIN